MEMPKRRDPSKSELKAITTIRKYNQPTCPACGMPMNLNWWPSISQAYSFDAWYSCQNAACLPQFRTAPITSRNLAFAVNEVYKASFWRGK